MFLLILNPFKIWDTKSTVVKIIVLQDPRVGEGRRNHVVMSMTIKMSLSLRGKDKLINSNIKNIGSHLIGKLHAYSLCSFFLHVLGKKIKNHIRVCWSNVKANISTWFLSMFNLVNIGLALHFLVVNLCPSLLNL
jgi:hypothetical protein